MWISPCLSVARQDDQAAQVERAAEHPAARALLAPRLLDDVARVLLKRGERDARRGHGRVLHEHRELVPLDLARVVLIVELNQREHLHAVGWSRWELTYHRHC